MENVETFEKHEVTLEFKTQQDLLNSIRILEQKYEFKISNLSDYCITKWSIEKND